MAGGRGQASPAAGAMAGPGVEAWLGPQGPTPLSSARSVLPQLLDTPAAPVAGHAAGVVVPKLDLGALHPQAVGVAGDGAGRCGAVAYLLAGGSAATGWSMGASLAPVAPSGASGSMFAGLPAAPVLDPLAQARATFNGLGTAEKRALMLYVESMPCGQGGAGGGCGALPVALQLLWAHQHLQGGRLPRHAGVALRSFTVHCGIAGRGVHGQ